MDGWPLARLLAYDPHTRTTQVLVDSLYAANGVTLGPADTYILVNEMTAYRGGALLADWSKVWSNRYFHREFSGVS